MSYRVLLADDSETIHKIITHTFSGGPFKLDIASTVEKAEQHLGADPYDIILLDFRLSESENGYQLARRIRSKAKHSSVVMLFESCDSPDVAQLEWAEVCESMVRPFSGEQLIETCQAVLQSAPSADGSGLWQVQRPEETPPPANGGGKPQDWVEEMPPIIGNREQDSKNVFSTENIPSVIAESASKNIPSDPGGSADVEIPNIIEDLQGKVPNQKELEYPDIVNGNSDKTSTSFIELNENEINETMEIVIERTIEDQASPENLWSIKEGAQKGEEANGDDTKLARDIVLNNMVEKLKPLIEKNIQQCCKEIVEKVAWEIIPDLAEKIIKEEIREIKSSVIK